MDRRVRNYLSRKTIEPWLRRNAPFLTVLLYLILRLLFLRLLQANEHDVLAVGKQFANPSWIPEDWYLNLDSGYRLAFNVLLYPLLKVLPLLWVAIVGRLGYYVLLAFVLHKYARALGVSAILIIPTLFLITEVQYVIAGEWMVRSLEAKSFSYAFLLLALVLWHERRFVVSAAFLGLSVSFHVLIGGYGTVAFLAMYLLDSPRPRLSFRLYAWAAAAYLVCASLGLASIAQNLAQSDLSRTVQAGSVYVLSRVPHHVLPANWAQEYGRGLWRPVLKGVLSAAMCLFAVLRPTRPFQRTLGVFALSTSVFALVGLGLYLSNNTHLLKYYFFRLPDVMLPFSAFLLASAQVSTWNPHGFWLHLATVRRLSGLGFSVLLLGLAAIAFVRGVATLARDPLYIVYGEPAESAKRQTFEWIKAHAEESAAFIVPPLEERFYVGAERAQFVSYKHCPQSEEKILEWYERMVFLNRREQFGHFEIDWTSLSDRYLHLSAADLLAIRDEYQMGYYIGTPARDLPFPVVYRNDSYAIYDLYGADGGS